MLTKSFRTNLYIEKCNIQQKTNFLPCTIPQRLVTENSLRVSDCLERFFCLLDNRFPAPPPPMTYSKSTIVSWVNVFTFSTDDHVWSMILQFLI